MGSQAPPRRSVGVQVSILRAIVEISAALLAITILFTSLFYYLLSYSRTDSIQDVKSRFRIGDGLDELPFRGPVWYLHLHGTLGLQGEADYDQFKAWATRGRQPYEVDTSVVTSDPKDRHLGEPGDECTRIEVRGEEAILQVQGFQSGRVSIIGRVRPR